MSLMTSPPGVLIGSQQPRVNNHPPRLSSAGGEAVEFAASAGLILDPWQQLALDVMLGERADGKWSAFEVGLLVARQNGKGAILEARELAGLFVFGERLILHTAHEFKTAAEAFLRVKSLVEGSPHLMKKVRQIRTSHGDEGIELHNGARLRFIARSKSSGRGFSGDLMILDEAQELPTLAMAALLPTLSARPNPQVVYTGTVPGPENDAEHFTNIRDRGRAGGDSSLAWLEWSPGEECDALDDPTNWAAANPALGYRMTGETIQRERNSLTDDLFARERLSVWSEEGYASAIPLSSWAADFDAGSEPIGPVCFAIDAMPDRSRSSIGGCGRRRDDLLHIDCVTSEPGMGWLVDRAKHLTEKHKPIGFVVNPSGPAGSLIPDLQAAGVTVIELKSGEMAKACGGLFDDIVENRARHTGQAQLTAAVGASQKRKSGDAWVWTRNDTSIDLSPLYAVTLARHGFVRRQEESEPWFALG